jgi:hypothetical protein
VDLRLKVDEWLALHSAADNFFQEMDVARFLTEVFSPPPSKDAQSNTGRAESNKVSGQG